MVTGAAVPATLFGQVGCVGLAWERALATAQTCSVELAHEPVRLLELQQHPRELDLARVQPSSDSNACPKGA